MNYQEELLRTNQRIAELEQYKAKDEKGFYTNNYQELQKLRRVRRTILSFLTMEEQSVGKKVEIHHIKIK